MIAKRETSRRTVRAAGLGATIVWSLISFCAPPSANAFSCRPDLMPNGNVYNCGTCHLDPRGGGPRNAFGTDVDNVAVGCNKFWGPEFAALDSDNDGLTNGEELLDPLGEWNPGDPAPGDPADVTHPGVFDEPPPPPSGFLRGDVVGNDGLNLTDAIAVLNHLFLGSAAPACRAAADGNGDGSLDIADPVALLNFLFLGGSSPPAPFPDCGPGEFGALGCEQPAC